MKAIDVGMVLTRHASPSSRLDAVREDRRLRVLFEVQGLESVPDAAASHRQPVVVIADLFLSPVVHTTMRVLKGHFPSAAFVMYDRKDDALEAQRARNYGAVAVLTARNRPERFARHVWAVGRRTLRAVPRDPARLHRRLTPREWDLMPYLASRATIREMAAGLTLSPSTVRSHLRNIYAKTGIDTRTQAAQLARVLLAERKSGYNGGD